MATMSHITTIAIFALSIITLCSGQCLSENDSIQPPNKDARSKLYFGEQSFTLNMLKALKNSSPNENIFFSPYSTFHALLLAYFGAKGNTETELKNVLNLNWATSKFDVMQAYRLEERLRNRRAANASVIFRTADKIFVSKEIGFKWVSHKYFNNLVFRSWFPFISCIIPLITRVTFPYTIDQQATLNLRSLPFQRVHKGSVPWRVRKFGFQKWGRKQSRLHQQIRGKCDWQQHQRYFNTRNNYPSNGIGAGKCCVLQRTMGIEIQTGRYIPRYFLFDTGKAQFRRHDVQERGFQSW